MNFTTSYWGTEFSPYLPHAPYGTTCNNLHHRAHYISDSQHTKSSPLLSFVVLNNDRRKIVVLTITVFENGRIFNRLSLKNIIPIKLLKNLLLPHLRHLGINTESRLYIPLAHDSLNDLEICLIFTEP